jgi:uncharacterized protein (TIGR04255 family)
MNSNGIDDICYKRNFLTSVIARMDFPSQVPEIARVFPKPLLEIILPEFPIQEPQVTIEHSLQIADLQVKHRQINQGMKWNFYGKDREKTLTITPNALLVSWTKYKSYADLKSQFLAVALRFLEHFENVQVSRFGIRAINEISLSEPLPLDWSKYLNPHLLHLFSFTNEPDVLSRVFHNMEFNFGEFSLRFQFGMHNPDYPARIIRKIFVLDLDAYHQGILDRGDITDLCDKLHKSMQKYFELSITDGLRGIMNE